LKLLSPPALRLRLLLPSIALIAVATMIPAGLRHPSLSYVDNTFEGADFFNNILLYMPLGIALSGTSLVRTFLFGFSLSTSAELLQLGYVDRIPSLLDITSNTCGALLGYLAAVLCLRSTGYDPKSLRIPRPIAAAAILVAIFGSIMLVRHQPSSDFSDWSPTFHLAIGNELTGDRPWVGTISEFEIYPFAMAPSQISDLGRPAASSDSAEKTAVNPPFELPPGGLIPPADYATHDGRPLFSRQEELKVYDTLVKGNQLTLLVWMRTSNLEQSGPARIITYSQDAFKRNFTLGQIRDTLTFRLRTPASGSDGTNPALYSGPVLSRNRTSLVAAVYDGRISRLYVDGKSVAQVDVGAKRPHLPRRVLLWLPGSIPIREIELGASETFLSGLFALGIFGLGGVPRRPSMRFFAGAAAGAAIGGTIWIFGVSEPGLGIRILLECVAGGLVIAASVDPPPRVGFEGR
jgi:VanZ like family/Concanavalin A-like lectin/glucanases superfamily